MILAKLQPVLADFEVFLVPVWFQKLSLLKPRFSALLSVLSWCQFHHF